MPWSGPFVVKNGSKICSMCAGSMPQPVSRTSTHATGGLAVLAPRADVDAPAGRRRLDRVQEQVQQHLMELLAHREHLRRLALGAHLERHLRLVDLVARGAGPPRRRSRRASHGRARRRARRRRARAGSSSRRGRGCARARRARARWYGPQNSASASPRFAGASERNVWIDTSGLLISCATPAASVPTVPSRSARATWRRERRSASTSCAFAIAIAACVEKPSRSRRSSVSKPGPPRRLSTASAPSTRCFATSGTTSTWSAATSPSQAPHRRLVARRLSSARGAGSRPPRGARGSCGASCGADREARERLRDLARAARMRARRSARPAVVEEQHGAASKPSSAHHRVEEQAEERLERRAPG